jgi:predicted metal-binding membrane protein
MTAVANTRWNAVSPKLLVLIALAAALGWGAMLFHHQAGHGLSGPHFVAQFCGPTGQGISGAALWLTGWGVMVLAMMLPPALPLFRAIERLGSSRIDGSTLITASALGFVTVWLLTGAALWLAGTTIASGIQQISGAASWSVTISGSAAILAGLYQFTPLKKACLTACRSPVGIVMMHWSGKAPIKTAARIGLHFGAICVGCCWALMLLTLAVGSMAMPIMVAVSFFMLAERLLPSVRFLVPAQAVFACLLGLLILTRQLPPGFLFI